MPTQQIINAAIRTIRSLPGWPTLRVLDLSCGDGHLIDTLGRDGCHVEGTHFCSDDYISKILLPCYKPQQFTIMLI